jgi:hypothetical protein
MEENKNVFVGWSLVGLTAVILLVLLGIVGLTGGDGVDATRRGIRVTARVSVTLFLLAFTASALWQLFPGAFTRWQRQNRRYLGVSFALSHFVHLAAILTLGVIAPNELAALTQPASWILGGLAYVLIAAMTATSFDRTAKLIGPRAWALLHTIGAYYVWIVFANSYISRAVTMPEYIAPAVAVVAALAVRIVARIRKGRAAAASAASASPLT